MRPLVPPLPLLLALLLLLAATIADARCNVTIGGFFPMRRAPAGVHREAGFHAGLEEANAWLASTNAGFQVSIDNAVNVLFNHTHARRILVVLIDRPRVSPFLLL